MNAQLKFRLNMTQIRCKAGMISAHATCISTPRTARTLLQPVNYVKMSDPLLRMKLATSKLDLRMTIQQLDKLNSKLDDYERYLGDLAQLQSEAVGVDICLFYD